MAQLRILNPGAGYNVLHHNTCLEQCCSFTGLFFEVTFMLLTADREGSLGFIAVPLTVPFFCEA
jgi:hypothetical protein